MSDDPYKDHPLHDEWHEFKYYTEGVTTARLSHVNIEGNDVPCVKVFMRNDATQEQTEQMYAKARDERLIPHATGFEESDEHIFIHHSEAVKP